MRVKKNFPIGTATYEEADRLGKIWVGEGARQTSGGGWLSRDGTRQYRPPTEKKNHNLQLQVFKQILKLILLIQMKKEIKLKMDI
ncbi:hypothetical protein AB9R03_10315 [Neisseria gonorrhoeae]